MQLYYMLGLLMFLQVSHTATESWVTFQAVPNVIHPVLTKTLELRCTVETDADDTNPEYLRMSGLDIDRSTASTPFWWTTTSPAITTANTTAATTGTTTSTTTTSTTKASVDVSHITSMSISRYNQTNGRLETVAVNTNIAPPTAVTDREKIRTVEGGMASSPVPSQQGYLTVIWEYPHHEQVGTYLCDVSILDTSSHPDSLTKTLEVSLSEPTVQDLGDYVAQNDKYITQLQQLTLELQKSNLELQNTSLELLKSLSDVESHVQLLRQEIQSKDQVIQELQTKIDNVENQIGDIKEMNVQTGSYSGCRFTTDVIFDVPYEKPPTVFLSANVMAHYHNGTGVAYDSAYAVATAFVNETGFVLICDESFIVHDRYIGIDWLAIGV